MFELLDAAYLPDGRSALKPTSLCFAPARVHAILGPNGAGKSSLLRLLAREIAPSSGSVSLHGRELRRWSQAELARTRAVLPQTHALSFPFTAAEVVALARTLTPAQAPDAEATIIREALAQCGAAHLADRLYPRLSGGERARVQLARTLAQIWTAASPDARYLLLDEPTAHFDLAFQHACLRLARRWRDEGVGVIVVLHDPNLVLRYADTVSVLCDGELCAHGAPSEVLTPALIQSVYGLAVERIVSESQQIWLAVSAD